MNKRTLLAVAIAALLSLPLALSAADEKKKGGGFGAMDTDKDGKVSLAEYKASMSKSGKMDEGQIAARFKELDKNTDGFLTQEEYAAGQKKKKKEN